MCFLKVRWSPRTQCGFGGTQVGMWWGCPVQQHHLLCPSRFCHPPPLQESGVGMGGMTARTPPASGAVSASTVRDTELPCTHNHPQILYPLGRQNRVG